MSVLTASIIDLKVDKLLFYAFDKLMKKFNSTNNNLSTSRTTEGHSMLAVKKLKV